MKIWKKELLDEKSGLQIAPLIDVVFLLLIYFMVSARLKRPEADISLSLPGSVSSSVELNIPDEQIIDVLEDGKIILNNYIFYKEDKSDLIVLENILKRYKAASKQSNTEAIITISVQDNSVHERMIDVLNACASAGIENISFNSSN